MFDAAVVSALTVLVAVTARRAVRGTPPRHAIGFGMIAAVCAAIHLGFHAAATAAPTSPSAAALVIAGWACFGLWWAWLSRAPSAQRRDGTDDDESGGDGRGGGPGDGPPPAGRPPGGDDDDPDWERFEREFAEYVQRREALTPR